MGREDIERVLALFERRGEVEAIDIAGPETLQACLARSDERMTAADLLYGAGLWGPAFTSAYDAYRMAAESVVLSLGYRVPAVAGAHRITVDVARVAVAGKAGPFAAAVAERLRTGRHEVDYFDPGRRRRTSGTPAGRSRRLVQQSMTSGQCSVVERDLDHRTAGDCGMKRP